MSAKVFISYSHSDLDHAWLRAFVESLRDRDLDVWFDEWSIQPGDRIDDALETGLRTSDAIVAVIPSASPERPNLYFELGAAVGAKKRLILVVDPSAASSIPYDLRRRQWITFKEPDETAREVAEAIATAA